MFGVEFCRQLANRGALIVTQRAPRRHPHAAAGGRAVTKITGRPGPCAASERAHSAR
ncbi:hypothetical protein NCCNTM_32970 [Mycolicibacterium sp. NCC-Tsukiji]|nr:hypothetical protein NCCNTM_32970 [Mycolicibacterium sp. NCC-Tsukiji]